MEKDTKIAIQADYSDQMLEKIREFFEGKFDNGYTRHYIVTIEIVELK